MVNSYSDTRKPVKHKRVAQEGPNQQERGLIQTMLADALAEAGYELSRFMAGLLLKVDLGTQNPFVANGYTIADEYWLKLIGMNIYGLAQRSYGDQIVKIASVADPTCTAKVVRYVVEGHISLLKIRAELHSEYVDTLSKALEKLGPLAQLVRAADS